MDVSKSEIMMIAVDLNTQPATDYFVKSTGYYCVYMVADEGFEYEAVVESESHRSEERRVGKECPV